MRPYLAIIKDSFRAAMASRVLYVLLLLITLLLIAIAPIHMRETLDWKLNSDFNVRKPALAMRQIVNNKDSKPASRVWELLPDGIKSKMENTIGTANEGENANPKQSVEEIFLQQEMIQALNKIIENPDFYRAEDWEGRGLSRESKELIESGVDQLPPIRSKRLNRLLLANVFPAIDQGNASALKFKYAIWEFPAPLSMTHEQFAQGLISSLPWYFEKFVLSVGLLIAIIVTANMIPETFEPGSLNLLLSKPISRWGLFTSKFIGGCVFIALCAAYLFLGLWLWLGLGMGVWDRAILISIPLYVVVFAIYFSVSSVVGLIWRSAIVSVILTLMFWAFCFTIGTVYYRFDTKMQNSEMIDMLPVDEQVYSSDILHQVLAWDEPNNQWDRMLEAGLGAEGKIQFGMNSFIIPLREIPAMPGLSSHLAPIYDAATSRIFASRFELGKSVTSGRKRMFVAETGGKLKFKDVGEYPRDTVEIFNSKHGVTAVTSEGYFYQLDSAILESSFEKSSWAQTSDSKPKLPNTSKTPVAKDPKNGENSVQKASKAKLWNRIGPSKSFSVKSSQHVDYSISRDELVIYRRGVLNVFKYQEVPEKPKRKSGSDSPDAIPEGGSNGNSEAVAGLPDSSSKPKGEYVLHASLTLSLMFDKGMSSRLAFAGDTILIAYGNGKVITIDAAELKEKNEYQPEKRSGIESVGRSQNGRYFAALYRNGNLWLLDTQNDTTMQKANVIGQGDICAFALGPDGKLWVTDNTDRAASYNLADETMDVRHVPSGGWIQKIYRYVLRPFYVVCPKPGEFYKVVGHLSSSGDTEANEDVDLNKTIQASDPWAPLWSGLAFMFAMLALGCLIFQFRDY